MNFLSLGNVILKVVFDERFSQRESENLEYDDFSLPIIYTNVCILADCVVLFLCCGALLSTLVGQLPNQFKLV